MSRAQQAPTSSWPDIVPTAVRAEPRVARINQ